MGQRLKKFRFAVTRPGGFTSGVWVAHGHRSDFYLTPAALHGAIKVSLHPAGGFRVAFTKEFLAKHGGDNSSREIVVWPKPNPQHAEPVHVLSLLVAGAYLKRGSLEGAPTKPLMLIELPEGPEHAEVMVFFAGDGTNDMDASLRQFGHPLVRIRLDNGDLVAMTVRRRRLPGDEIPGPKGTARLKSQWGSECDLAPLGQTVERSLLLFGDPAPGQPLIIMDLPRVFVLRAAET
jgi:hypothetical protein